MKIDEKYKCDDEYIRLFLAREKDTKSISFNIPGEPQGKGRPRFSTRGGFVKTYTPEKTASYENFVKVCYLNEFHDFKITGEIDAKIIAYFPIPKNFSKKKRQLASYGEIRPAKKPDCDNIAKIILDSLNGIAYEDDKQIIDLKVSKFYSDDPHVNVILSFRNMENVKNENYSQK